MPAAHLSLCLAAFTVAFLGCAAVAAGESGQGGLPKRKMSVELTQLPLGNVFMLED